MNKMGGGMMGGGGGWVRSCCFCSWCCVRTQTDILWSNFSPCDRPFALWSMPRCSTPNDVIETSNNDPETPQYDTLLVVVCCCLNFALTWEYYDMSLFFVLLLFFVFNSHVYVLSPSYTLTECKKELWEVLVWEWRVGWGESGRRNSCFLSVGILRCLVYLLLYHSSCIIFLLVYNY